MEVNIKRKHLKMKTIRLFLLLCLAATMSCSNNSSQVPASVVNIPNSASGDNSLGELPKIEFQQTEHDFGKVIQGEKVSYSFKFKNSGNSDLVIAKVSTSCGCTASDYPRNPLKPGEEGTIEVSFDSEGKQGFQNKALTVVANTQPSNTELSIKAMVFLPENQ
jgi:hypothetical protein